jgi:hypothetical protein
MPKKWARRRSAGLEALRESGTVRSTHRSGGSGTMRLDYHVLDVFTDRRFSGNPLAVVLGAVDMGRPSLLLTRVRAVPSPPSMSVAAAFR